MSSRTYSSRPRRTRLYDANYNIGQSYYKPTLDSLDRRQFGKAEPSEPITSPRLRFNLDDNYDDELKSARARASRAITEDSVFDSRGGRTFKGLPLCSAYDDDLDEDVQASLSRIRSNRPKISSLINDLDLEDSISKVKRRANLDLGEKLLDVAGEDDIGTSIRSRALKMVSRTADADEPSVSSRAIVSRFKRTTITSDAANESVHSAASLRAKASKARLADIESEISERSERLMEREKRAANLKKLLADNDIEEVKSIKKVTF